MASPRPFNFDEFRAQNSDAPAPERTFSAGDIAAARAEGVAEGRRLAMETIAADEAAQLARICDNIDGAKSALDRKIPAIRADILAVARIFLEEFSSGLAEAREFDAAADLLRRLTDHSEDRRAARLVLNAKSAARLGGRLAEVINQRGLSGFVSIEGDQRLSPGEARIEWRGGRMTRGRAEINAAVAALFDHLNESKTESGYERS